MALMGIDIGSTGCKCAVYDYGGTELARGYREYNRPAGSTEFDGLKIWSLLGEIVPETVRLAGEPVDAVAVASMGEAFAPVDVDGSPLHSFMQSTFKVDPAYLDDLRSRIGERIQSVTGLMPLARYSLVKMAYLRKEKPHIFAAAWKFMKLEDFIVFRLCGRAVSDYSVAARTAAFNLVENRYDAEILAAVGLTPDKMCEVLPTGTAVGGVTRETATLLGLAPGTPVVLGGHDVVPEHLCAGLLRPGMASAGLGTFESLAVLNLEGADNRDHLTTRNFSREYYPLSGYELVYGINPNAGGLLIWFRNEFGAPEMAEAERSGDNPFRLLDNLVGDAPSGLLVVPHFVGSGVPEFAAGSRGTISGLRMSSTRGQIYQGFLEGIAFEMAYMAEQYEACGVRIAEIAATSGGARSRAWLRIRADILGLPIVPMHTSDTTLAGCAMLAGVAAGVYADLREAAKILIRRGEAVQPDAANHGRYREEYEKYRALRSVTMDFWK